MKALKRINEDALTSDQIDRVAIDLIRDLIDDKVVKMKVPNDGLLQIISVSSVQELDQIDYVTFVPNYISHSTLEETKIEAPEPPLRIELIDQSEGNKTCLVPEERKQA